MFTRTQGRNVAVRTVALVVAGLCSGVTFDGVTPIQAAGTTYYVSPTGNDSNPGSETSPFRTIQRAANVVNPGDSVIVEDGTYTGTGAGTPCASSVQPSVVCLARGGTSTAPVTFRARNHLGAKIDGRSNASTYGFNFLADFIRIEGFDIFGMGNATNDAAGIVIYGAGHDVVIKRNAIHDIGRLCASHQYGMNGIFVQNARVRIEGNHIYDIGRFAAGENGCSPSNAYYKNHDHGIYVNGNSDGDAPGARDILIANNLFTNIARGWAVQVYPGTVANLSILHNTFAEPNPYNVGHIIVAASTTSARIMNNVFYEPTTAGIYFYSGTHTGMKVTHNLSSRAISDRTPAGVTFTSNQASTDPLLTSFEYEPRSSSPAIDRGVTLADVPQDIQGGVRPSGAAADVGAYEVPSTTSPTPTPTPTPTTDTTKPTVRITAPLEGARVRRNVTITAEATDAGGIANVRFTVNGNLLATDNAAPYSAVWNSRHAAPGNYILGVVATDKAGNTASASITVNHR